MKAASVLLVLLPAVLAAQSIAIGDYVVPTYGGQPTGIATGPDGALWFTEQGYAKIGRITPAGAITEYQVDNSTYGSPSQIAAGPDGALWFTQTPVSQTYYIGRITTTGTISEYLIPASYTCNAQDITAGPDGAVWFTCPGGSGSGIGRITSGGTVTLFHLSTTNGNQIAAGPDGALWFTAWGFSQIGRITTAGAVTVYTIPTANSYPAGITAGPDGALWFAEPGAGQIGRITTAGAITEYPIPTPESGPSGITAGPGGALWFSESYSGKLGRITTAGVITEYALPNCPCAPQNLTTGPDGELWVANQTGSVAGFYYEVGRIDEVVFVNASLSATPDNGFYYSALNFQGSGFAPNENVRIYTAGVGSAVLVSATTDSNGSFTTTGRAPASPYGSRIFLGLGETSGKLGAASFSIAPHLFLTPNSGPPGATVTVTGFGFPPFFGQPAIYWKSPFTYLGLTPEVDSHGIFHPLTITVPAEAAAGANNVFSTAGVANPGGWGIFTVQ